MSQDLGPGDVCRVIEAECLTAQGRGLIGLDCRLLLAAPSGERRHPWHPTFVVRFPGGEETVLCAACLRKHEPDREAGSWRQIARAGGWCPERETERYSGASAVVERMAHSSAAKFAR